MMRIETMIRSVIGAAAVFSVALIASDPALAGQVVGIPTGIPTGVPTGGQVGASVPVVEGGLLAIVAGGVVGGIYLARRKRG